MDWLPKYKTDDGLDLPRLLNDDFMEAIKLLFNNKFYVSSTKLLMSFIDTLAFIEYGDTSGELFKKWLSTYTDLSKVGASKEELWEHRNSLLHMSTPDSRKVVSGKVRRLTAYVGVIPSHLPQEDSEAKYFSLWELILAVANGIGKNIQTFNENPDKIYSFIERYDLILSDKRMLYIEINS